MKLDLYLTRHKQINLKSIKDLKVRHETIKVIEENREKKFDIGQGNNFLDMTPKTQATKTKIDKWNFIKVKSFAQQRKPSAE